MSHLKFAKYGFILLCAATLKSYGQDTLVPGNKSIRYDLIKPGADTYKIMTIDSSGKILNESIMVNMVSTNPGKNMFIKTQFRMAGGQTTLLDSSIAELLTLKPLRMSMHTSPFLMQMDLRFDNKAVYVNAKMPGKTTDTIHQMINGYFDSNVFEYLLGLLDYKQGSKYFIHTYTFEKNGDDPYIVTWIREENYRDGSDKNILSSLIEVVSKENEKLKILFWIDKSAGKVLKQEINMGRGMKLVVQKI